MGKEIKTDNDIIIFQSSVAITIPVIAVLFFALVVLGMLSNESQVLWYYLLITVLLFFTSTFFLFNAIKNHIRKIPLLKIDKAGFYTKKSGDISWGDVHEISVMRISTGIEIVVVKLKNGKSITINANI
ncbi:hypothetical protein MNBD_BACTEROID04-514, partial [hydrothermal vent metagenome]